MVLHLTIPNQIRIPRRNVGDFFLSIQNLIEQKVIEKSNVPEKVRSQKIQKNPKPLSSLAIRRAKLRKTTIIIS